MAGERPSSPVRAPDVPSSPASHSRVRGGESVRLRLPVEISGPVVHQAAPALEEITACVGRLCGVLYRMGERGFDHLAGCARPFRSPVPEARPEPMRHGALVRGCGQAYALQTVEPVTYRCGTRRVCQARSSGSERYTRARPHAVAPMNCVPEDSRRRSTCTGRTHSPRARADGHQTPSSTVAGRAPSPS